MTWRSHFQILIGIYIVVYLEAIESFDKVMDLGKNVKNLLNITILILFFQKNITRIANAIQVTICLLVSTICLLVSTSVY